MARIVVNKPKAPRLRRGFPLWALHAPPGYVWSGLYVVLRYACFQFRWRQILDSYRFTYAAILAPHARAALTGIMVSRNRT